MVHELQGRGVALRATEQPVDTGTAAGKAFLVMLDVFAEFETNLRPDLFFLGVRRTARPGRGGPGPLAGRVVLVAGPDNRPVLHPRAASGVALPSDPCAVLR